jgi:hypothetical protein
MNMFGMHGVMSGMHEVMGCADAVRTTTVETMAGAT